MIDLQPLHTFGLRASANQLIQIDSIDDLSSLPVLEKFYLLGEGSNTVFIQDFGGCIVRINLTGVEVEDLPDRYRIKVAAGENWHRLVSKLMELNIYGLENLALIPGSVGAAPIQNIGAYGAEFADFCKQVEYWDLKDGQTKYLDSSECQFGYRTSVFKTELRNRAVITGVYISLPKKWCANSHYGDLTELGETPKALEIYNKVISMRTEKLPDPNNIGNAGSFFKNPVITAVHYQELKSQWGRVPGYKAGDGHFKVPAAWLIDRQGFKGKSLGGITCHQNQPLVLTNTGHGTGEELLEMARDIQRQIYDVYQIKLENEVRLVGKEGLIEL